MKAKRSEMAGWKIAALLAVLLAGMIVLSKAASMRPAGGAEDPTVAAAVASLQEARHGHVYPAQLMAEHPLYPQLLRLDAEIQRLTAISSVGWERDWQRPFAPYTPLVLIGPELPQFGAGAYERYCQSWQRRRVQAAPQPTGELAPDLQARLRWSERNLRTDLQKKLQAACYARDLELARKEAELVRKYQEALMNADLLGPRRSEGSDALPSQHEQILAAIEAQMAQQREASQRLLAQYEAKIRQEAQVTFAQAQQELWDKMKKRLQTSVSSGSKIGTRLSKRLSSFESTDYTADVLEWKPDAEGIFIQGADQRSAEVGAFYEAAAGRAASALRERRSKLSRDIYSETVLAVRKSAMELGAEVCIPPLEPATGDDLTASMRPLLRQMWQR